MKYDKTTKELILDWARERLRADEAFSPEPVVAWFAARYPLLDPKTVRAHLEGMCANNGRHRRHHAHVRSDTDWDHFFKLGPSCYRRYDPSKDPKPVYE
jgi:hypothetical protein